MMRTFCFIGEIMNILVIGGTRFFGIHMVNALLEAGHDVTIATRGKAADPFGDRVKRIIMERTREESVRESLSGKHFDVIIDKLAYCSNDIKYVMEAADFDRYICMSSTAVYNPKHINTVENDFDGNESEVIWCNRADFPYDQIKRQAEYALWQCYSDRKWLAVRYPFVIGQDDYTKRLRFYVENTIKGVPMNIDNIDCQMSFIRSDEAGRFMAFLVDKDVSESMNGATNESMNGATNESINGATNESINGAINGASTGTISIREILDYVEKKTGTKVVIDSDGQAAPYNGENEYSICTEKAQNLGYHFTELKAWIFELLDFYIQEVVAD